MNEKERNLYAAIHKEQARSERETLPPDLSYFDNFITRFEETYKKEESTSQKKPVDLFVKKGGYERFSEGRKNFQRVGKRKQAERKQERKKSEDERKKSEDE